MTPDRIWYALIDPVSGGYSASRMGLAAMNIMVVVATFWMLVVGTDPTTLLAAVVASDATVYAVSTHKQGGGSCGSDS